MAVHHLKKMHSMCKALSVEQAVHKIKGPAKVNEVLQEVKPEERSEVFSELRSDTDLKKQVAPMGGIASGLEMRPGAVQTSAQTAMRKADPKDDFYANLFQEIANRDAPATKKEEIKQPTTQESKKPITKPTQESSSKEDDSDLESMFNPTMKDLKDEGDWKSIADMALDFAGKHEADGKLDSAKKYYKIAQKYYNKHIEDKNLAAGDQGPKPKATEVEIPRKVSPETSATMQAQAKETERIKNLPTSESGSKPEITQALFGESGPKFLQDNKKQRGSENAWEQIQAPQINPNASLSEKRAAQRRADAINRFKELRRKVQQKFVNQDESSNLMAEGDNPSSIQDIVAQGLREATNPARIPEGPALAAIDREHERNRPRTEKEKQELERLQSEKQSQLTTTERQISPSGEQNPAPGTSIRNTPAHYFIPEQTQQEHARWFQARTGAKTGQGLNQEQLRRLQGGQEEESTQSQTEQRTPRAQKTRLRNTSSSPVIQGDASALAEKIAAESARRQLALDQKQKASASQSKKIPSANESLVTPSLQQRKEWDAKRIVPVAEKSMEKSAKHSKNPAFIKKPGKGTIAGVTPESDVLSDPKNKSKSNSKLLKRAKSILKRK